MKKTLIVLGLFLFVSILYGADEITRSEYLRALKGNSQITIQPSQASITWNGTRFYDSVISVTNLWTSLTKGSVNTNGIMFVWNQATSTVAYVSFDCGNTTNLMLKGSEFFCWRLDQSYAVTSMAVKCASGTNDFRVTILED